MNKLFRILFFSGVAILVLFEVSNVYFIMPMPGSQELNSIDAAYFLNANRWLFRTLCGILILACFIPVFRTLKKFYIAPALILVAAVIYLFNFRMNADSMFRQPESLVFKGRNGNKVGENSLALCIEHNGEVKAYPVRFIQYHHQVRDTVGGMSVMVTYCNVCRTGRIYLPLVNGHEEKFRLVGMDHYNAMFEDKTTRSWWRQSTGEAITGPLKGLTLPETESMQLTLSKLFELAPGALVMQPDAAFISEYDTLGSFELGQSESRLTRTDSLSWKDKSWVIGVSAGQISKAYDWNRLKRELVINDMLGEIPVLIAISSDGQNFAAFERPAGSLLFSIKNDTLKGGGETYDFAGKKISEANLRLKRLCAYQEFWHSWKYFHPGTLEY